MIRTLVGLLLLVLSSSAVSAQATRGWDPAGLQLTRVELEQLLARFEETVSSPVYSEVTRDQARAEARLIRRRLEEGDLQVGDRVFLRVENQQPLTDTFTVMSGRKLILPDLGEVVLDGVLRSELEGHLTKFVARFIKEPNVQASSLVRLEIAGAVGKPGFYTMPTEMLMSDVLMLAGGPATNAAVDRLRIERGKERIWDGEHLRDAVVEGRTLDQLSVRAGDRVFVPSTTTSLLRNALIALGSVSSLLVLASRLRLF